MSCRKFFSAKYFEKLQTKLSTQYEQIQPELWQKQWVVFAKKPFGSPKAVVEYLGRYTHKIATSNHHIKNIDAQNVTFDYKDYRVAGVKKQMALTHQKFIRRFSLHILPKRFLKIRHYSFLSSTWKRQKLKFLQENLKLKVLEKVEKKPFLPNSPFCKTGNLHRIAVFDHRGPPAWYLSDSQNAISCEN